MFDVDKDRVNDFLVTERTQAPSVVWYRKTGDGWTKYVVDDQPLRIEAGSAVADVDGDGIPDTVDGGRWFKRVAEDKFVVYPIDEAYAFSRSAAGQLVSGGSPAVVLVVGDGNAPLIYYEYRAAEWHPKILVESFQDGHSLDLVDYKEDGHLDIFCAEMRLGNNPDAKAWILLGDGYGSFTQQTLLTGYDLHESRMIDLDGDNDLDIFGKPYTWQAPRLDLWMNLTQ